MPLNSNVVRALLGSPTIRRALRDPRLSEGNCHSALLHCLIF